jgi:hypothetical protein
LFLILKIRFDWSENLYHLSYGMVDLPSEKWKPWRNCSGCGWFDARNDRYCSKKCWRFRN